MALHCLVGSLNWTVISIYILWNIRASGMVPYERYLYLCNIFFLLVQHMNESVDLFQWTYKFAMPRIRFLIAGLILDAITFFGVGCSTAQHVGLGHSTFDMYQHTCLRPGYWKGVLVSPASPKSGAEAFKCVARRPASTFTLDFNCRLSAWRQPQRWS